MFFAHKIKSIKTEHRVLEIGPGVAPHPRADIYLDKSFSEEEAFKQRGWMPQISLDKEVVYYDGKNFPFKDKEFDYVICSHVLEHVEDVDYFLNEMSRIAKAGYLEYPTVHYDFIYNIPEHLTYLYYDGRVVLWMKKNETGIEKFSAVQKVHHQTMMNGYHHIVDQLQDIFFQGFEWFEKIEGRRASSIDEIVPKNTLCRFEDNPWYKRQLALEESKRPPIDASYYSVLGSPKVLHFLKIFILLKNTKNRTVSFLSNLRRVALSLFK